MNQDNQQLQQSAKVSQEELAKTQVLNFTDVQEIARYERKTSKRPAALFAFAGILAITLGFSYKNIMNAVDAIPSMTSQEPTETIYTDNILNSVKTATNSTVCTYTSPLNGDGTYGVVSYNFIFNESDLLQKYTMTLTLDPEQGNDNGKVAVQNTYNSYKELDVLTINGYQAATTYNKTGMKSVISTDLTVLDKAQLTPKHNASPFTAVSDSLNDTKENIVAKYTAGNYVCK